jgi:hypothetical protein
MRHKALTLNELLNTLAQSDWPGTTSPITVLFVIVLAFAVGLVIGYVYMWTHEALSYSRTFVSALAILPLIVALMLVAMAGSLFVAFGLLGVVGVVRFRNVLKDTRDTSFILWGIMEGMAIGTMRFSTAFLGTVGIAAAFLCLRFISFGERRRYDAVLTLRVTGEVASQMATLQQVLKRYASRLDLASERRATKEGTDITYRLLLRDTSRSGELQTELTGTPGFESVAVYMHEDEAEI